MKNCILSKKTVYTLSAIIVIYTLTGFFLLPIIGKNIVKDKLSKFLHREVTIEKISVNPFALTAKIDDLIIKNPKILFSVKKIFVNVSISSLFTFTPVISELYIEKPYVNIVRNRDGSFNFSYLLNSRKQSEVLSAKKDHGNKNGNDRELSGFIFKNISISQGEIRFEDKTCNVSHIVKNISVSLPFLSTKKKYRHKESKLKMNFVLNKAKFNIHIQSTPFAADPAIRTDIKTSDIDVVHYLPYLSLPDNMVLKSLNINFDINAYFNRKKAKKTLFLQGKFNVLNADLKGINHENLIEFPVLNLDISKSDILGGKLNISKFLIKSPEVNLSLLKYTVQDKENHKNAKDQKITNNKFPVVLNLKTFKISDVKLMFQNFPTGFTIPRNKMKPDAILKTGEVLVQFLDISNLQSKREMINIPEFKVKGAIIDFGNKKISTGEITTRNGKILIKRLKNGEINLVKALSPEPALAASTLSESVLSKNALPRSADPQLVLSKSVLSRNISSRQDNFLSGKHTVKTNNKSGKIKKIFWDITMNSFNANGFDVLFKDLTNKDPVSLDFSGIAIKAGNLKNFGRENTHIAVNMKFNGKGNISIRGSFIPSLLSADIDINLDKIDIKSLQPYFTDAIKILVTSGNIQAKGKLRLNMEDKNKKSIDFKGQTSVNRFICLDKQSAKEFFKCNSLYLSGLEVSVFPVKIRVKDISLTDFYSRIIINRKGTINLNTIFKENIDKNKFKKNKKAMKTAVVSNSQNQGKPFYKKKMPLKIRDIKIKNITLQAGDINFSDYRTQPGFTADMKKIAGSLTSLSSREQSKAILHLQGLYGQSSPLEIVGRLNPLSKNKFADIDISFKDIELTNFTPYSSKYLGYKIEKGKLNLNLKYLIKGNHLTSDNKIKFDNFTLGDRVKNDTATSLPVSLAISLLKDRKGQINLDLPVTGKLNDPNFKISSIVFKMISNLIIKVVTSPFSIIGSMFGGGKELAFVDFKYGDTKISALNYKKIDKLIEILRDKPSVKLEIRGFYDKVKDYEALKMKKFYDLIKAEKLKKMLASGSNVTTLKQIKLNIQDMNPLIDLAYARAKFPKPRDNKGYEKQINLKEKKKLLITSIHIGKNDLNRLAMKRSENIKAYLILKGKISKERIFLLEPEASGDSKGDSKMENTSRVEFSLK